MAALPGCGPTAEQVLQYEHVLAAVGMLLGLAMWRVGYALGRRLGGRGCLCATCGHFRPVAGTWGGPDPCPVCGQPLLLASFDAVTFARLRRRPLWPARRKLALWATLLAAATFAVLSIPSLAGVSHLNLLGGEPDYENVFWFPIWFSLSFAPPYVGLGTGLFFYNYHLIWVVALAAGEPERWWWIAAAYALTIFAPAVFWYVGLRRRRWGWMVPVGWGAANAILATVFYLLNWPWK